VQCSASVVPSSAFYAGVAFASVRRVIPNSMTKPALILIDVINTFDFEGSQPIVDAATNAAVAIEALASKARTHGIPVIYANDNFRQWRSDFNATVDACIKPESRGAAIATRLRPQHTDYFILKPKHSAFFATPLELLLRHLGVDALILAGFATDLCVLFTAHDAHMRGFNLFLPEDCTASNSPEITQRALDHLREALACSTGSSEALEFTTSD
jgi:nicotinamidase-related amidase